MLKSKWKKILKSILFALCVSIVIAAPIMAATNSDSGVAENKEGVTVLSVRVNDSFEGGKGSRDGYLQSVGNKFSENGCYISVTSLTANAAKQNLKNGNVPDVISYGAGLAGIEGYITGAAPYKTWCRGGYCFLTLNGDFSDINAENTIINAGKDNLSGVAAMFCGIENAKAEKSTAAYVQLIKGKYKYLLGTQRDVFRLRTRGEEFTFKPITQFNDLYQNISITATDPRRKMLAKKYVDNLLRQSANITKLGLFYDGMNLYEDDLHAMEGILYEYKLIAPISETTKSEIDASIQSNDLKKLKSLFI